MVGIFQNNIKLNDKLEETSKTLWVNEKITQYFFYKLQLK